MFDVAIVDSGKEPRLIVLKDTITRSGAMDTDAVRPVKPIDGISDYLLRMTSRA